MLKKSMTYEELSAYVIERGIDLLRFDWGFVVHDWKSRVDTRFRRDGDVYVQV
jgi:hypothetical protein